MFSNRLWLAVSFVFGMVAASCATPVRVSNGQIEFATCTINGQPSWSIEDRDAALLVPVTTAPAVVNLQATAWEVNLSSCLYFQYMDITISFAGYSDWMNCQTRAGLKAKFLRVRPLIDALTADFPANDPLLVDLKQRFGWLKAYYVSLP